MCQASCEHCHLFYPMPSSQQPCSMVPITQMRKPGPKGKDLSSLRASKLESQDLNPCLCSASLGLFPLALSCLSTRRAPLKGTAWVSHPCVWGQAQFCVQLSSNRLCDPGAGYCTSLDLVCSEDTGAVVGVSHMAGLWAWPPSGRGAREGEEWSCRLGQRT